MNGLDLLWRAACLKFEMDRIMVRRTECSCIMILISVCSAVEFRRLFGVTYSNINAKDWVGRQARSGKQSCDCRILSLKLEAVRFSEISVVFQTVYTAL